MAGIVYLKLTGQSQGVIEGKSVNPDFGRENAIECTAFRINITKPHDRNTGLSTGRRFYEPITFVKDIDKATPRIARALVTNEEITEAEFRFFDSINGAETLVYTVTTQKGTYFLWVQKPSLAFFVEFPGAALDTTPASVFMVFRTQDPQDLDDNRLQLKCDGATTPFDGLPGSKVVPAIFHNAHYLTFELPRETFDVLARCTAGEVSVGGVGTRLSSGQLQGLRDLEATFPTP